MCSQENKSLDESGSSRDAVPSFSRKPYRFRRPRICRASFFLSSHVFRSSSTPCTSISLAFMSSGRTSAASCLQTSLCRPGRGSKPSASRRPSSPPSLLTRTNRYVAAISFPHRKYTRSHSAPLELPDDRLTTLLGGALIQYNNYNKGSIIMH